MVHWTSLSPITTISQWINRSTLQYFNATVRLQGQQDMLVDSDYIYFFIFGFFNNSLLEETWKTPKLWNLWHLMGPKNWFLTSIHVHVHMHKCTFGFHNRTLGCDSLLRHFVVSPQWKSFPLFCGANTPNHWPRLVSGCPGFNSTTLCE